MEGNLRFKIDWASLIVGRKFTVFALFYFVFEGNFQVQAPREGLYLEGRFNGGFFALRVWGAYTWRGLFSEFYGNQMEPDERFRDDRYHDNKNETIYLILHQLSVSAIHG